MKYCVIVCLFLFYSGFAQEEDAWVYFTDKPSYQTYFDAPLLMLSQRAIDRRAEQNIAIDINDVPVEEVYITTVSNYEGVSIKAKSKWLNALHVQGTKEDIDKLQDLIIVSSIQFKNKASNKSEIINSKKKSKWFETQKVSELNYGMTTNQTEMLQVDFLHDRGYTGLGYKIAILDAGFKGVETFDAFSNLHDGETSNGEVLGGYDYVNKSTDYYGDTGNTHGLSVLSTIGGYIDNQFIGTAPHAEFYLFVTEDVHSETPLEESLWVEAAEQADSIGVDIINTSLGYTTFDNSGYNYSYDDMDGKTTFISRGAEIACSRGMLLVTSAGNEGNSSWKYISAPADVESVLSIGAVDEYEDIAGFSSFGPTADNRVKPDVLAQGQNVIVINSSGNVSFSNGTSFSAPIMAGATACLWQAFPSKTSAEIRELIKQSSDLYNAPTAQKGYGIPDFKSIYDSLSIAKIQNSEFIVYPNPFKGYIEISTKEFLKYNVTIANLAGAVLYENAFFERDLNINLEYLTAGMYILRIQSETGLKSFKIVKK